MFQGVVFDCDGTLVDSEQQVIAIEQRMFRELGWDATTREIAARFVGKAGADYQDAVREVLGPLPDNWREPYEQELNHALRHGLSPIRGVTAALTAIPLPKAVASNSTRRRVLHSLEITGLARFFDNRIAALDDVAAGKPSPDPYLRAAELLELPPETCIAVEDSPTGVTSARAAGMITLGFAGSLTPAEVLRQAGAQVFTDMAELPELVTQLTAR
jgi:HAD superfamily hydrolase (TIGR01509 family)